MTEPGGRRRSTENPPVSVIIPHYSDLDGLDACLRAIAEQTYPLDQLEVIVADNDSPEGLEAVEALVAGRARLVVVDIPGAGAARNGGVAASRHDLLAFTDSDCRPHRTWLEEGIRALEDWDFVGGRMIVSVGDPAHQSPVEAFESLFAFRNHAYVRDKSFTVTANLICPRTVFDSTGPFDTTGLSEDVEWCHRAKRAGYRLGFADAAIVYHPARKTWPDLRKKWARIDQEMFNLTATRPGGRAHWLRRTLLLPASAVYHLPAALLRGGVRGLSQRLSAVGILFRLRLWRFADSLRLLIQS